MRIESKIKIVVFITGVAFVNAIVFIVRLIEKGVLGQHFLSAIFVFIPLAMWLSGICISRMISRPLRELYKSAEFADAGDMDCEAIIGSKDELGQFSKVFNRLIEKLRKATVSLDRLNEERTGNKDEDQELRESEEQFRKLFEESNDAIFIYDMEGRILDVNSEAYNLLSYSREELLKIPFLELHTDEELSKPKEAVKTDPSTGAVRFESKFKKADSTIIDVEISSSVVDLERGIMQGTVHDITERKKLEEALRMSEEKFRTFMETANDLMHIVDRDGNFTYVNGSMATTLGYSAEKMIGMSIDDISSNETRQEFRDKYRELIDEGEINCEPVWITKNGKEIEGEIKIAAIYDDGGNFAGSRSVFRDVSERKKVERSQRLAQLGKLVSDMAHEVNNPLQIISGRAELSLMTDKTADKTLKSNLGIIIDQCTRAKDIIQRLLVFSRPSKGRVMSVNINDSIDVMVDLVKHNFLLKDVKIVKNYTQVLPFVKVDEKQVQQVFMNLLRNAAEAMDSEGGTITVSTLKEADNVRIDFKDTGVGMSEKNMKHIFDPFFTTKEQGTGLGLSICYAIMEAHGGELKYASKLSEGTTAIMLLPVDNTAK